MYILKQNNELVSNSSKLRTIKGRILASMLKKDVKISLAYEKRKKPKPKKVKGVVKGKRVIYHL